VCGEAFQRSAERLIPSIWAVGEDSSRIMSEELGDLVACATNLAFAIELYLKALLTQLQVPATHDLRALFDGLPQSIRLIIEEIYLTALRDDVRALGGRTSFVLACGQPERPSFEDSRRSPDLPDLLTRSKDLFQSRRYVFEVSRLDGSPYQFREFEYCFLRTAAEAMRVEATVRLAEAGVTSQPDPPLSTH
jgi:hypothetical protein